MLELKALTGTAITAAGLIIILILIDGWSVKYGLSTDTSDCRNRRAKRRQLGLLATIRQRIKRLNLSSRRGSPDRFRGTTLDRISELDFKEMRIFGGWKTEALDGWTTDPRPISRPRPAGKTGGNSHQRRIARRAATRAALNR